MLTARDLEKQTRPKQNGASDGKSDFPPTDAELYASETEQEINAICEEAVASECEAVDQRIQKLRKKVSAVRQAVPTDIVAKASVIKAQLKSILSRHADAIGKAADDVERRAKDLRQFKLLNDISYEPDYEESKVNLIGIGALIVVAESTLNAFFFGEASNAGLVGGFFTAGMISLANVLVGFFAGVFILRQFHHIKRWRLIFAIPGTGFVLIAGFVFNLIVGHYREALMKNPDAEIIDIVPDALSSLFDVRSLNSIILIVVGFFIFLTMLYKGYKSFDTYPGYYSKHRAVVKAEDRLSDEQDHANKEVDRELGDEIEAFEKTSGVLSGARAALERATQAVDREAGALTANLDQIEQAGDSAMKIYRLANQHVRSPRVPAPSYFRQDFVLDRVAETSEIGAVRQEISSTLAIMADAEAKFRESQVSLTSERVDILKDLESAITNAEAEAKKRAKAEREQEKLEREALQVARA